LLFRGILVAICVALICAVLFVCLAMAQEPAARPTESTHEPASPASQQTLDAKTTSQSLAAQAPITFQISGIVKSGKTALPGVTVTAANTLTGKKYSVASAPDGSFTIKGLARGRYVVKAEFMGFAPLTEEVVLNPENPIGKVEAELVLASRQQEQTERASEATAARRGFQSLAVDGLLSSPTDSGTGNGSGEAGVSGNELSSLPMNGAGVEAPTESIALSGTQGRTQDFGNGNEDELQQRMQEFRERAQAQGSLGGAGGFGGGFGGPGGGGPGGGGPVSFGRMGRGFDVNKPHGFLYAQDDNAGLDARSYALNGQESEKASYNTFRFGAFVGGPLNIPHILDASKSTFYSVGWNGTRGSSPYDAFSTVPTMAERGGDFSGLTGNNGAPIVIYDPVTGLPFPGNKIDPTQFSGAAASLLNYIPEPNLPGSTRNFHYVTTAPSESDAISMRLIHNFSGSAGPRRQPGGGGRRAARGPRNNLNLALNWSRISSVLENPFPSLAGNAGTQGLNASARWVYGKGRVTNTVGFTYNHNRTATSNLYSGVTDVAGNAGITGVSTDPFDWGLSRTSFNSFTGFSDPIPSRELDQTYTLSEGLVWSRGKHAMRFGADYRRISQGFRSARNAEGSFIFTGFATGEYLPGSTQPVSGTGSDFADFLLGLPQQTSLQGGTTDYEFRSNSYDFYAQDDWRIFANLSVNFGLRYEYVGPYTETENRIANLDVSFNPTDTSGFLVLPGQTGIYSGGFPNSLVRPDRNNFGPRIGIAWKAAKQTVVRAGYGINYNLAQYGIFVRNFAFQPPFATTATNVSPYGDFLTLENGFPTSDTSTAVTNNYSLDPNYKLGYVQVWNVDIQRQLPHNMQLNIGYNGAKGTDLDTERALVPTCVAGGTCQTVPTAASAPFIYESSEGDSTLQAASVRIRKRMSRGLGISASYVFSKSLDDAASIGGGSIVVAQNPFDIPAERSLSSFDQTHKFTGTWMYDLPFGDGKRFFTTGAMSHALDGWQWSGSFTIGSGFYFTPNVLGASVDIDRGVSGSLRANVIPGVPISSSNPTTAEWFNTAAFCAPGSGCVNPAGSSYGDAGRNIIEGPWQINFNMSLSKTITIKETRALELRLQGSNIFNTPYFSSINTTVNSQTFGQVVGVGTMRRITMVARFRF
jgi:trimeric autotransporter adhesin